ncbi:MAG: ATP-binding protein, partial [Candidatus Methanomethylophilaceae archaeon]|nr:ATP-binding protein [Candidatus Methanomethylophilaceae archaeon]
MVENQRIEYKEGWNPESILHTVCAFANDYDNLYGGYLIIGIKDDNGRPSPDSPGVPPDKADKMAKDLLNLVNMIEPGYEVSSAYEDYRGIGVFVIWAPGGPDRPYKCPVSPGKNEKAKGFFIRKQSGTVKANPMQEKELFRMSETTPYDDRINYRSSMEDLDRVLISSYLENTNSRSALK